jgi:hypothetical protein
MPLSSRLYHCHRCHAQVIICSRCDRGQRYCSGECQHLARTESRRRAAKKYQSTRAGKFNNAQRQQRFRAKNKQKVTHHGSTEKPLRDVLEIRLKTIKERQQSLRSGMALQCHHCGALCEPFLRHDFLHRQRYPHPN